METKAALYRAAFRMTEERRRMAEDTALKKQQALQEKESKAKEEQQAQKPHIAQARILIGELNTLKNAEKGLADAVKRLVRDSGLGAKIYVDKLPFAGKTFELGKELNIDPMSAALNGGEDYRLLFTIPIGKHDKFRHDFQTFDIIGHLAKPEVGAALVTPDGLELPIKAQGWKND